MTGRRRLERHPYPGWGDDERDGWGPIPELPLWARVRDALARWALRDR